MANDNLLSLSFPAVARTKVTAVFDGGHIGSDGGVMLLGMADWRFGLAERLARCFLNHRFPLRITSLTGLDKSPEVNHAAVTIEDPLHSAGCRKPVARPRA